MWKACYRQVQTQTTERDVVVDEIEDRDNANLSVTKTMSRLGTVVFLFIFNIGISIFVFLLTGMMIFSQVLFIIYAMFLPVSFILSMIPTYEGMAKRHLQSCLTLSCSELVLR